MYVLSFDIGIKNLAYCLFQLKDNSIYEIVDWNIIDIRNETDKEQQCSLCNKVAKYIADNYYYCLSHAKKQYSSSSSLKIPKKEHTPTYILKQKMNILKEIAKENDIKHEKMKKNELILAINQSFAKKYITPIDPIKASNKITLFEIGKNIKKKFDYIFKKDYEIDYLLVENQLGPNALRMSIIQWMVIQYFITSGIIIHNIEIISPSNKLQGLQTTSYTDRKKKSVDKCIEYISNNEKNKHYIDFIQLHTKKDDLADCYLQGDWFIKNKISGK